MQTTDWQFWVVAALVVLAAWYTGRVSAPTSAQTGIAPETFETERRQRELAEGALADICLLILEMPSYQCQNPPFADFCIQRYYQVGGEARVWLGPLEERPPGVGLR